ncbi:MAG TPA: hypothetical protein VIH21_07120, partial [Dehalococcoidia bacterium]
PPQELRKGSDITGASAEDIASMLGSKSAVIPPAGTDEAPPPASKPAAANGAPPPNGAPARAPANGAAKKPADAPAANGGSSDGIDLATFVDKLLRPAARQKSVKLDGLLNGSCHAVSWQDGVLTLGFYQDAWHKQNAEQAQNKRIYEEIATSLLGAPVSIRCIIAPKPAKALSSSPLVQHAVQNLGAKIVSEDQEPD